MARCCTGPPRWSRRAGAAIVREWWRVIDRRRSIGVARAITSQVHLVACRWSWTAYAVRADRASSDRVDGGANVEGGGVDSAPQRTTADAAGRIMTVPNAISFARLIGVPVFLYLLLVAHQTVAA